MIHYRKYAVHNPQCRKEQSSLLRLAPISVFTKHINIPRESFLRLSVESFLHIHTAGHKIRDIDYSINKI